MGSVAAAPLCGASAQQAAEALKAEDNSLTGEWFFRLDPGAAADWSAAERSPDWRPVWVPHTWNVEPASAEYAGVAWYRRMFDIPAAWSGGVVRIEFEAVFHSAVVWVNGHLAGRHTGKGYTAFTFDITRMLRFGARNEVAVRVDNSFNENMLPRGRSSDWTHDGGIYRPVRLLVTPQVYIERVDVDAAPDLANKRADIRVAIVLRNAGPNAWRGSIGSALLPSAAD